MFCVMPECNRKKQSKAKCKSKLISFFKFPRNPEQLKKWLKICQIKPRDFVGNEKRYVLCMYHFKKEDIGGDLQVKMGWCTKRYLVPGAIPIPYSSSRAAKKRLQRLIKRNNKKLIEELLRECKSRVPPPLSNENRTVNTETINIDSIKCEDQQRECFYKSSKNELLRIKDQLNNLRNKINATVQTEPEIVVIDDQDETAKFHNVATSSVPRGGVIVNLDVGQNRFFKSNEDEMHYLQEKYEILKRNNIQIKIKENPSSIASTQANESKKSVAEIVQMGSVKYEIKFCD